MEVNQLIMITISVGNRVQQWTLRLTQRVNSKIFRVIVTSSNTHRVHIDSRELDCDTFEVSGSNDFGIYFTGDFGVELGYSEFVCFISQHNSVPMTSLVKSQPE